MQCECRGLQRNDPNPDCPQHGLDRPLPVMQQPGYVFRARKHIVARNVRVGDRVAETRRDPGDPRWTVIEVDAAGFVVKVRFQGRSGWVTLAMSGDRIWVDRAE